MVTELAAGAIESRIYMIRGLKVMLDRDLAALYGVETKTLKRAVRRNVDRFPEDFMFTLVDDEILRCQNGTSSWGGLRYRAFAFTEQGVAMLSGILHSKRAVQVNVAIMRAFVRLRETLALHKELAVKLEELERRIEGQDSHIQSIFAAIRGLMEPPAEPPRRIGFRP